MAEALEPLRLKKFSIVPYLDDLLLFQESKGQLLLNLQKQGHLNRLGWLLNQEKSDLVSAQRMRLLGYTIDSPRKK